MKNSFWNWLLVLIFSVFWFKGYTSLDPDFGWHLKMGETVIRSGVPITDPFSYTMPNYNWVDVSWLSGVAMAWLYHGIGKGGLAIIWSGLTVIALVAALSKNLWRWALIPVMLGATVFLPRTGVRPQVADWVFLAVILRWLDEELWRKRRWLVPILMVVWANLHGGFPAGLVVVGLAIGARSLRRRKWDYGDVVVVVLSGTATFLNPYGIGLWKEIWAQMELSGFYRKTVMEWMPFYYGVDLGFWAMAIFTVGFGWRYKKKVELWKWVIFGTLFLAGLSSLRHMALFVITTRPLLAEVLQRTDGEFGGGESKDRWKWFYGVLISVSVVLAIVEVVVVLINYKNLSEERFYPGKAIEWLRRQNLPGQVFSDYGWGGYLVWKYPVKKVFVHGGMATWRKVDENLWVFKDFIEMSRGEKSFGWVFEKYDVEVVLWPKRELTRVRPLWQIKLPSWWPKVKKTKSLIEMLEEDGWKKEYEDEVAVVLRR